MTSLFRAFFWLELHLAKQYRWALIAQLGQFLIFLLIFSRLPIESDSKAFDGVPYVHFVLTGLVFQIYYEAILNGPTSRLNELQVSGQLQVVLSAPYPRWMILLVSGAVSALTGTIRAALILIGGSLLFEVSYSTIRLEALIGSILFTSTLCSCLALLNVAGTLLWPRVNLTGFFSSLLLGLLSGVFIPIDQLPAMIRPLSELNPLRWALDSFRYALGQHAPLSIEGWWVASTTLVALGITAAGLFRWADRRLTTENRYQYF